MHRHRDRSLRRLTTIDPKIFSKSLEIRMFIAFSFNLFALQYRSLEKNYNYLTLRVTNDMYILFRNNCSWVRSIAETWLIVAFNWNAETKICHSIEIFRQTPANVANNIRDHAESKPDNCRGILFFLSWNGLADFEHLESSRSKTLSK